MTEPEQWAVELRQEIVSILFHPDTAWSDTEAAKLADEAIQRAFEERERELREAAQDQAWIEARELVRGTNADLCKGGAGQAYRLIIEGLTNAIHNRDLRTFNGRVEHHRLRRQALATRQDAPVTENSDGQ